MSTRLIRKVFIVFFLFLFLFFFLRGGGGVFSFHVPLLVFSCSSLVCVVVVILHVTGLCK